MVSFLTIFGLSLLIGLGHCYEYCGLFRYCEDGYYCCNSNLECCKTILSTGVIVGICIGAIVFIAIVIVLVYMVFEQINKRNRVNATNIVQAPVAPVIVSSNQGGHQPFQYGQQPQAQYGQGYGYAAYGHPSNVSGQGFGQQYPPQNPGQGIQGQGPAYPPKGQE